MLKKITYTIYIPFLILLFLIFFENSNIILSLSDNEFVSLIKNMAIKNHTDPTIFQKIFSEASTDDLKMQAFIKNQFYECVFNHKDQIKTKNDLNLFCGHFIKFK